LKPPHWKGEPNGAPATLTAIRTAPVFLIVMVSGPAVLATRTWPKSTVPGETKKPGCAVTALPEQISLSSPLAGVRVIGRLTLLKGPAAPGAKVTVTVMLWPASRSAGKDWLCAVTSYLDRLPAS
jgi:hypothetical protein